MACVFLVTLVLLADLRICLMVLLSVVLTLVDIVGFLHFWGITIDIISCVNIVLAIGLCVDYSVHIGHAFIVAQGEVINKCATHTNIAGTREERAQKAVASIGLAVLNGGVTTALALVLLGASSSHVFLSFFKVGLTSPQRCTDGQIRPLRIFKS
jgi:predicted RND superfamily exporter protein